MLCMEGEALRLSCSFGDFHLFPGRTKTGKQGNGKDSGLSSRQRQRWKRTIAVYVCPKIVTIQALPGMLILEPYTRCHLLCKRGAPEWLKRLVKGVMLNLQFSLYFGRIAFPTFRRCKEMSCKRRAADLMHVFALLLVYIVALRGSPTVGSLRLVEASGCAIGSNPSPSLLGLSCKPYIVSLFARLSFDRDCASFWVVSSGAAASLHGYFHLANTPRRPRTLR